MTKSTPLEPPVALKIVSGLFVLYGFWAVYDMVLGMLVGSIRPNFGIFCLLIGPGLLGRSEIARVCALAVTVVLMVFTLDALARYVADKPPWVGVPLLWRFIGHFQGAMRTLYVLSAATFFFALNVWQVWVLMRPDVRRHFGHVVRFH